MTQTIIALLSIVAGILGGHVFGSNKLGFTAKTIAGVFGSIFFIKSFARLGFDANTIMQNGTTDSVLFFVNMIVSFLGGGLAAYIAIKIEHKITEMSK